MKKMAKSTIVSGMFLMASAVLFTMPLGAQSVEAEAASYVEMGDKFVKQGELKLAIGAYSVAIDTAPGFALAYFRRGLAHQSRSDLPLAIADYTKTLELVP